MKTGRKKTMETTGMEQDVRKRNHLTPEEKYQIFLEAVRAERNGGIAEVIRKYGIHSSDLTRIRRSVEEGAINTFKEKKSRKPKVSFETYKEKEEEVKRLEQIILELAAEITLLKKRTRSTY